MQKLQDLTPSQIPILRQYLDAYPRQWCDYAISNLLTWGRIYHNQYMVCREHLVIYNPKYAYVFYPVGPGLSAEELRELVGLFKREDKEASLILLPEDWQEKTPGLADMFHVTEERDWADYIYAVDRMVRLSGKKLAKKKNLVSQYVRAYPDYHVLPITPDKHESILRFTEKWRRERNAEGIYLNTEFQAIKNTLEMWDKLPVEGIIICHKNLISAYAVYSRQTSDTATIHFEKFDPDMKGSAQLINWETARHLQGKYKWLNREQDMGLEGLRQSKMSYEPDLLLKFIVAKPL